jgi:hypothetical protein
MIELEFRNVDFYGGRKRTRRKKYPEKNPLSKGENPQQTQPEPRIEPTTHWGHSGERRAYYRNTTHDTVLTFLFAIIE